MEVDGIMGIATEGRLFAWELSKKRGDDLDMLNLDRFELTKNKGRFTGIDDILIEGAKNA